MFMVMLGNGSGVVCTCIGDAAAAAAFTSRLTLGVVMPLTFWKKKVIDTLVKLFS